MILFSIAAVGDSWFCYKFECVCVYFNDKPNTSSTKAKKTCVFFYFIFYKGNQFQQ